MYRNSENDNSYPKKSKWIVYIPITLEEWIPGYYLPQSKLYFENEVKFMRIGRYSSYPIF